VGLSSRCGHRGAAVYLKIAKIGLLDDFRPFFFVFVAGCWFLHSGPMAGPWSPYWSRRGFLRFGLWVARARGGVARISHGISYIYIYSSIYLNLLKRFFKAKVKAGRGLELETRDTRQGQRGQFASERSMHHRTYQGAQIQIRVQVLLSLAVLRSSSSRFSTPSSSSSGYICVVARCRFACAAEIIGATS
jgi:hypothetical protein